MSLPEYPFPRSLRGVGWLKWDPTRFLHSTMHIACSYEVQGVALALFDIAMMQSPLGTLPDDGNLLARMLRLEVDEWARLCSLGDVGPLRNWRRFDCQGEVRFGHDVLIAAIRETLEAADAH